MDKIDETAFWSAIRDSFLDMARAIHKHHGTRDPLWSQLRRGFMLICVAIETYHHIPKQNHTSGSN